MGRRFERAIHCTTALAIVCYGFACAEQTESSTCTAPADPLSAPVESDPQELKLETVSLAPLVKADEKAIKLLFRHLTYPAAWKAAQKSNRPILVYISMPNCPHSEKMKEQTYHLDKIETLVAGSFETISADRFTHATLIEKLNIRWYPTTVLVTPDNKVLDVIEGFVDAKRFQRRLQTSLASLESRVQKR